jgi:hypothetical protein
VSNIEVRKFFSPFVVGENIVRSEIEKNLGIAVNKRSLRWVPIFVIRSQPRLSGSTKSNMMATANPCAVAFKLKAPALV